MEGSPKRAPRFPTQEALGALQADIGYKFKDIDLLIDALTHASFSETHNDVLHFLGREVINLAIALHGVKEKKDVTKNDLDKSINEDGNSKQHDKDAAELGLRSLIMAGRGVGLNTKILSEAFTAVIGAITLDGDPTSATNAYWKVKKWSDHRSDSV